MAQVDDAEAVVIGIGQHNEVGVSGIQVPVNPLGAQRHQAVGLRGLNSVTVTGEAEVTGGKSPSPMPAPNSGSEAVVGPPAEAVTPVSSVSDTGPIG